MQTQWWCLLISVWLTFLLPLRTQAATVAPPLSPPVKPVNELILCGWFEVFILDLLQEQEGKPVKVWSWLANENKDLPWYGKEESFGATDECKPVNGGKQILITSSGLGIGLALIERETKKLLCYARAENAHSADLLPGDRIAVATSVHEIEQPPLNPDRLTIYQIGLPAKELYHTDLFAGHGVVWDEQRKLLWALANNEIRAYALVNWETEHPSLEQVYTLQLPEGGGHDLYPVPNSSCLSVTTNRHCWLFDRDTHSLVFHHQLAEMKAVKSIAVHPVTGQLAYVQAEGEEWWAENVHLLHPDQVLHLPGERLYKARWNTTN